MTNKELPLCACGCGQKVANPRNKFINGHNRRGENVLPETKIKISKTRKENKGKPKPVAQLCKCGCGELAKPGNRFIHGHSHRGDHHSQKAKDKMRESAIGKHEGEKNGMYGVSRTGKDNPMYGKKHSPESCKKISNANRNPSDSTRKKMSAARINSDAAKAAANIQRGGQDIVNHHYIYDHSDLSKYTMKMTRSRHARLHRLMQKAGIKVPHINVKEK